MAEKGEGEPNKVVGYLITTGKDNYLGIFHMALKGDEKEEELIKKTTWDNRERPEDARVFSKEMTALIAESLKTDEWRTKPTHVIPAVWSEDGGVVVTGEKIKIEDLPPLEKN